MVPKLQDYSRDFIRTSNIDFFSSLITERKFIDTLKDFTIFVESIDEDGNMKNIYLKDGMNKNTQIISARMGRIIEDGSKKYLNLNYGQILDIETDDNDAYSDGKIIKFNNTTFNISKFRSNISITNKRILKRIRTKKSKRLNNINKLSGWECFCYSKNI